MDKELKNHISKLLKQEKRMDGRKPLDFRQPISVEYGVSATAEGSARVKIGETEVIGGVKLSLETPYDDTPDSGNLMVGVEMLPMSNPDFEAGPPSIDAIELGRVVDRGIRESKAIDTKKLCIEEGEKVWGVIVDICPINDAGNLFDACALAAVAALKDAKFPEIKDGKVDYKTKTDQSVPLATIPISVTVRKIGDGFIVDSTNDEESAIDARLTVAIDENGELAAMQKGGDVALTIEEVDKMVGIALEKEKELRSKL